MKHPALVATLVLAAGCPHGGTPQPSGQAPTVAEIVDRLTKAKDELHSFTGEAVMEYWLGSDRFKGDVLAMGEPGAKVRIAALSPAGSSTVAEMACDGSKFVSVNYQANCVLTGPCNKQSIASFFGIELAPDDFLHLALGTPPLIAQPTGSVTWDADHGVYQVKLSGSDGTQTLALAVHDQQWDVVESERIGRDGRPEWTVKNAAFTDARDPEGKPHRVPGKSRFTTPNRERADLSVEWRERTVNLPLAAEKFTIAPPAGLPTCTPPPR
jgi:hypothetical protein